MLKQQRDDAYKTYKQTSSEECWQRYKILRNLYVKELRNAKNGSVRQEIDRCSGDSKRLWKCLKSLITPGGMKKSSIVFEGDEGGSCSDEMTARKVNKFFVKSVEEIHKSIPAPQLPEVLSLPPQNLFDSFQPITMEKLIEIVASLKKCSGTENITKQVLLDSLGIVGGKLLEIVNVSLQQGVFPKEWKKSTVIPIPKVAKSTKPEDHRPINMLPLYEKVLETVVKEQLLDFINREEILLTEQSGFRKKHSCESALNLLLLKWKQAIENKRTILAVFVDLKRAFETIDRRKLVEVLRRYGIAGNVLKWFSSYLEERTQVTLFNGVLSPEVAVDLGVPQGSVLGPLLFILYMNDIKKALHRSEVNLFADDTVIYVTGSCREECCEILNAELNVFADWLKRKKLKLNVSKTKCMLITNQRRDDTDGTVYIDGEVVERVDVIKYLGVMLDNKLNFDEHINYTIRKAARKLGIMYRLNKYLSFDNKLMIYNTLIAPHFDYCASILFTATQQQQKRMQLLQNKVMRLILGCERLTPRSFMLDCLRWMSVRQRVEYNTLVFIFRLTKGMAPQYLTDTIVSGSDVHQHYTRQAREIRLFNFKMTSTQNSLFYKGYRLFNMLPEATRNSYNLRDFKKFCKSFVKQRPLLYSVQEQKILRARNNHPEETNGKNSIRSIRAEFFEQNKYNNNNNNHLANGSTNNSPAHNGGHHYHLGHHQHQHLVGSNGNIHQQQQQQHQHHHHVVNGLNNNQQQQPHFNGNSINSTNGNGTAALRDRYQHPALAAIINESQGMKFRDRSYSDCQQQVPRRQWTSNTPSPKRIPYLGTPPTRV